MARALKVFSMIISAYRTDGIPGSQIKAIIAVATKKEAARLLGVTIGEFTNYASVTGNDHDIATAMAKPGQLFGRALNAYDGEYIEITRHPYVSIPRPKRSPIKVSIPVYFTSEELEMIAGYFRDGNSPLAQSIYDKASTMVRDCLEQ